ncbi:PLP-dependent aminotransferase family protein [Pararhizobium antarcticum]|uniref:Aminotransferase n=1 Tax=Pararhizobium antarcticum TaxID=1798805 RepID=A0A657LU32_9HYPH|nr:PLP-dependent aminotransferase family protein [Pararhizobium antarcticum]OJF98358.1 aminotransferase [Pararhizobium antarcticum]
MDKPTWLTLDRTAGNLEGQIYRSLRERILNGQMAEQRLTSTRALAATLGVARSTVVRAYERLKAEGFLRTSGGAATRTVAIRPLALASGASQAQAKGDDRDICGGKDLFRPGVPDLSHFPHAAWARCLASRARSLRIHDLGYASAEGLPELQSAILDHISATRGVSARPEQVMIVPSTGAAIDLLARVLIKPQRDDVVWMEEPGYKAAHALFLAAGARLEPVPCDGQGIDVARARSGRPRLIYTTPSHQYPTGVTMSLKRRLALLELAREANAVVVEDDYDSEFHYGARPIAALQGIDRAGVVAYLGTFSKMLAPGLRVAYMIVPPWLVSEIAAALYLKGAMVSIHLQAALADFMREGRLRAHVRRMTAIYGARMAATVDALSRHCADRLGLGTENDGLHLATWFCDAGVDDHALVETLGANGLAMQPLSQFYLGRPSPGLLFGIARVDLATVDKDMQRLGALLSEPLPASS